MYGKPNWSRSNTVGILDHEEARKRKTGGKVLGFFYWLVIDCKLQVKQIIIL